MGLLHTTTERAPARARRHFRIERRRRQPAGLDPVLVERSFEGANGRADDPEVAVTPVVLVLRVAEPVVGDAHAAGKRDVAVDDQRLAVSSGSCNPRG
jgi:hypothetical protein